MKKEDIIKKLITERENTLSVKSIEIVKTLGSMGNPKIMVGTMPYYEWSKVKEMDYIITYGRYLNCEMLVYDKQIRQDKDFIMVTGKQNATAQLNKILSQIIK